MKRKVVRLRLSPNEEAQLIREEHDRRRKLRIQQVREQQRNIALHIRSAVQQRRERELQNLEDQLRSDWERQKTERIETLQRLYQQSLEQLGQGHRSAKENEPDWAAIARREEENQAKAEARYREALQELKEQRLKDHEEQTRFITARKKALQAEKERASKVASLPPPPLRPIENIDAKKQHVVKKSDVNSFSATYHHMPEIAVDREDESTQPDAHEMAEQEEQRLQEMGREAERGREEQLEKARLRGKHALRRERLTQDRERFLSELEHMQQTDLLRRRRQVSQMPAQIFQPLYKRQEFMVDCQREMEFAFEDMYTGERRVKGDLLLQLVPEPLPAQSTDSQNEDLDLSLDNDTTPVEMTSAAEETGPDQEQTGQLGRETAESSRASRPAPRKALQKLLNRIRTQRDHQWSSEASLVTTGHAPPNATEDQVPERDSTIDTGSLSSEERVRPCAASHKLLQPSHSPPALETTEETVVAGTVLLPDTLANKMQEFELERQKKEEELEREKQQQIALLQELEEQKARLEQELLKAQQERETLKATVSRDLPVCQVEVPVRAHEPEVSSLTPREDAESVPTAAENDHTRRIREYQQRLLEQNKVHKRSLEVARQRLQEYQRSLQIRNMAARSTVPPAVPPSFRHPPAHSMDKTVPPVVPHLPPLSASRMLPFIPEANGKTQVPAEIHTRESTAVPLPPPLLGPGWNSEPGQPMARLRDQMVPNAVCPPINMREKLTTEHLPERPRASSASPDYRPLTIPASASSIPLRSVQDIEQRVANPPTQIFLGDMSLERQRQELNEAHSRLLAQREAQQQRDRDLEVRPERLRPSPVTTAYPDHGPLTVQPADRGISFPPTLPPVQAIINQGITRPPPTQASEKPGVCEQSFPQPTSLPAREGDLERQRQELKEAHSRVLQQREAVAQQRREQEEARRRQEEERDQMRRQREAMQTRLDSDAQPAPEPVKEVSEDIGAMRLKLLSSLLKAMEEASGGSLAHLQEDNTARSPSTTSPPTSAPTTLAGTVVPPPHLAPRPTKPPVARVRLGAMEITSQHELSAIQEVETPADASMAIGPEDSVNVPASIVESVTYPDEEPETSAVSRWSFHSSSVSSRGDRSAGRGSDSESASAGSGGSSKISWRERLMMEAGTSPESESLPPNLSQSSSDPSRGGTSYMGPAIDHCKSPTESTYRPPDPDFSTTISTGSYVTSDPEQNSVHSDGSQCRLATRSGTERAAPAAESLHVTPTSRESFSSQEDSALGTPRPATDMLFLDSDIHHIMRPLLGELDESAVQRCGSSDGSQRLATRSGAERVAAAADSLHFTPTSRESFSSQEESALGTTRPATDTLFHDSDIHRIIDKYTKELDFSFSTVSSPDRGGESYVEENIPSVVPDRGSNEERPVDSHSVLSETPPVAQRYVLDWDNTVNQILARYSVHDASSLADAQEQDASFRPLIGQLADQSSCLSFMPLIGQLADQSSCLAPDQRDLNMEQLTGQQSNISSTMGPPPLNQPSAHSSAVAPPQGQPSAHSSVVAPPPGQPSAHSTLIGSSLGQPTAHSSMIFPPSGQSVSVSSADQGGWDSTLCRIMDRLSSHQTGSSHHDPSGAQKDYGAGLPIGQMELGQSSVWLDEGQESLMRPLLGVLDESAVQRSGSSGEGTSVDLAASVTVTSAPVVGPEAQSVSTSVSGMDTNRAPELDLEGCEVFPASDSFHPLVAEVTHNETVDPSMTFHLPGQETSSTSPEGSLQSAIEVCNRLTYSTEEDEAGATAAEPSSVMSEPSPDQLRAEELSLFQSDHMASFQESFDQLNISQCHPHESVDYVCPVDQEGELVALSLPSGDCPPTPKSSLLERGSNVHNQKEYDRENIWKEIVGCVSNEKGILEESLLTLVSLTDTTLEDQDTTSTDEKDHQEELREEESMGLQKGQIEEQLEPKEESVVSFELERTQKRTEMLLEFQWNATPGSQEDFQQKRRALLQRSARRVEEIKAKRNRTLAQTRVQVQLEEQHKAKDVHSLSIPGQAEDRTTDTSQVTLVDSTHKRAEHSIPGSTHKKPERSVPVSDMRLKKLGEVKICTPEQRKLDVSEMHQRTQRLYDRLEEVKRQKEFKSRQEACAKNRLKAKEFHQKTLQKLRAKKTLQ